MIRLQRIIRMLVLLAVCSTFPSCGQDPGMVKTRIKFLIDRGKLKEALEAGLKGAEKVPKGSKGEILLDAAEVAIKIYRQSSQKSDGLRALEILQRIIEEKLVPDGRPYVLAARIFQIDKQYDKAVDYYRQAESASMSDPGQAGTYRYYLIELFQQMQQGELIIREAREFYTKYPAHERTPEVRQLEHIAQGSPQTSEVP